MATMRIAMSPLSESGNWFMPGVQHDRCSFPRRGVIDHAPEALRLASRT
jgi:hypothetical protein